MNVFGRLKNAYDSGGIEEISRKFFYHCIYRINNYKTKFLVDHKKIEYGLNTKEIRDKKVIVSLTSFPPRFDRIHICLKSILLQSVKPDKIIVYFASDTPRSSLTNEMLQLENFGVEFRFDKFLNLRSHSKYFYAMKDFPEDIIVTADDDLYYPSNWLSSLLESYKKYPQAISARRVHRMKRDNNGLLRYNLWKDQCRSVVNPCNDLLATGCGGVLYPPHSLKSYAFDVDKIKKLCLAADDIWLKCMEVLSEISVVWVKNWEVDLLGIESRQKEALSCQNVDRQHNDICLKNVMDCYNISVESFFK